jgi:hypothetical protein
MSTTMYSQPPVLLLDLVPTGFGSDCMAER